MLWEKQQFPKCIRYSTTQFQLKKQTACKCYKFSVETRLKRLSTRACDAVKKRTHGLSPNIFILSWTLVQTSKACLQSPKLLLARSYSIFSKTKISKRNAHMTIHENLTTYMYMYVRKQSNHNIFFHAKITRFTVLIVHQARHNYNYKINNLE